MNFETMGQSASETTLLSARFHETLTFWETTTVRRSHVVHEDKDCEQMHYGFQHVWTIVLASTMRFNDVRLTRTVAQEHKTFILSELSEKRALDENKKFCDSKSSLWAKSHIIHQFVVTKLVHLAMF